MIAAPPAANLIVRDASGEVLRVPFEGEKLIVGRIPQASVRLDHAMVSRQHAELWRDPQGQYHVRDLKSRNGTLVNGHPVTESVVNSGDQVGIGPFVLTIQDGTTDSPTGSSTRIVLSDGAEARISSLRDHAPPRIDVTHLTTLNEFGQKLLETPSADARAAALCKLMVGPQFRGQWGVLVRVSRHGPEAPPTLLHEAYGTAMREPYLSRSVLKRVRETGDALLASNATLPSLQEKDLEVSISPSIMSMAAVACPVTRTDDVVELLYVMLPPTLGSAEWLALVNLAVHQYRQAESAWAARKQAETIAAMERELDRARQIQTRLVPKKLSFEGLDVAIGFVPCHFVGGDYVDAVKMKDGRTLLAIADVCGKGLSAALIASSVHTMIHAGVLGDLPLADLMGNLNGYLTGTMSGESFVTMIAIAVDATGGGLEIVNAGHPPPLVVAPGQPARRIDVEGNMPLSKECDAINSHHHTLGEDEMLVLYSDGLSELPDAEGQLLGISGLCEEVKTIFAGPGAEMSAVAEKLSHRLDAIQAGRPAADDRTFLVARRRRR